MTCNWQKLPSVTLPTHCQQVMLTARLNPSQMSPLTWAHHPAYLPGCLGSGGSSPFHYLSRGWRSTDESFPLTQFREEKSFLWILSKLRFKSTSKTDKLLHRQGMAASRSQRTARGRSAFLLFRLSPGRPVWTLNPETWRPPCLHRSLPHRPLPISPWLFISHVI